MSFQVWSVVRGLLERTATRFTMRRGALLFILLRHAKAIPLRGVAPADEAKYSGATFRCFNGAGAELSSSAVNDEFCDCADGSDEPGTGACAGQEETLFFCVNDGSVARKLYASRVGDGICDCCDGSDEATLAARAPSYACANVCVEEGKRALEDMKLRADVIRQGLALQAEAKNAALSERENWRSEISKLKEELPALEAAHEEAKKAADEFRQAEAAAKEAEAAAKAAETTNTTSAASGEDPPVEEAAAASSGEEAAVEAEVKPEDEKPQVSEYAKWMDGAESALSNQDAKEEVKEEAKVSEYAKWMDGAEEKGVLEQTANVHEDGEDERDEEDEFAEKYKPAEGETSSQSPILDAEKSTKKTLDDNKAQTREFEEKLEQLGEEYLGYAALAGKTIEKKVTEFKYKLKFFDRAEQDHTSLGSWKGFTGPRTAVFDGGASCWNGPQRKLTITFDCGLDAGLIEVTEPARCVYEGTVVHPGACSADELAELSSPKSRVVGPRDEL